MSLLCGVKKEEEEKGAELPGVSNAGTAIAITTGSATTTIEDNPERQNDDNDNNNGNPLGSTAQQIQDLFD